MPDAPDTASVRRDSGHVVTRILGDLAVGVTLVAILLAFWLLEDRKAVVRDVAVTPAAVAPENQGADPDTEPPPAVESPEPMRKPGTNGDDKAVAIIDSFEPFTPNIIETEPAPPTELTTPLEPEPPSVVEVPAPQPEIPSAPAPQTVEFFDTETKATSVGFVVDCSSSMEGDKFRAVCNELASSILRLKSDQEFFVVFFNDQFFPMTGLATSPRLVEANSENKQSILKFLLSAKAYGGTDPEPALNFITALRPSVIYLLTDGAFNPLSDETFAKLRKARIEVHTIAFETGGPVAILEEIARRTSGTCRSAAINTSSGRALFLAPPGVVQRALRDPSPGIREEAVQVALLRHLPVVDELIDMLRDPDVCDAVHGGLRMIAEGSDFGPQTRDETGDAVRRWKMWWRLRNARDWKTRVLASLNSEDRDTAWTAAVVARVAGLDAPDALVSALRTAPSPIWQELHAALVRCCPAAGDLGPSDPSATAEQVAEAADRWQEWRRVEIEKEAQARLAKRCKTAAEYLRLARLFLDTKPDVVERRCEEIIRDYGDTPAAEEAKLLLETLRRDRRAESG